MDTLQTITQALFAIGFVGGAIGLFSNYFLFNALQKKYPAYYRQIGQPKAFARPYLPTSDSYVQSLRGMGFVYSMVFRGIPANFPEDSKLKKQARFTQYLFSGLLIIFVTVAALFYPAFK